MEALKWWRVYFKIAHLDSFEVQATDVEEAEVRAIAEWQEMTMTPLVKKIELLPETEEENGR